MSFWKNALLIAGGAAAGYLASRSQEKVSSQSAELTLRSERALQNFVGKDAAVAQFFDSKYGAPFKVSALSLVRFAANVKAGMDEKEAELKQRFEEQKQETCPGSIDTWEQGQGSNRRIETYGSDSVLEGSLSQAPETEADARKRRLARDADLGTDFFS